MDTSLLITVILGIISIAVTIGVAYWQVKTTSRVAATPALAPQQASALTTKSHESIRREIEESLEQYVTTIDYDVLIGVEEPLGMIEGYLYYNAKSYNCVRADGITDGSAV